MSVRPGRITAVVQDRDPTAHRADVLLQELSAEQWERFLDMAVERAGHVAALLDRDMPPHLVEDAADAGVEILPGLGDLEPGCDCGAWDHCGHTAALCYQMASLLDQDPFVLLLMRGHGEREVLDDLQVRGVTASEEEPAASRRTSREGVDATEAYVTASILPPLPSLPELPARPGSSPSLDTETPPTPGVEPTALAFLASRAAAEAHRMLAAALAPGHEQDVVDAGLTLSEDAVRLAADSCEAAVTARLAEAAGRGQEGLEIAVRAWRYGGAAALSVLEEEWTPEAASLARTRTALESAWDDADRPRLRAAHNRWTVVGAPTQLPLGRDGRWWPYREEHGRWVPAGPAALDPATALTSADGEA